MRCDLSEDRSERYQITGFPFNRFTFIVKEPNSLTKVNIFNSSSANYGIVLHLKFVYSCNSNALVAFHIILPSYVL